MCYLAIFAVICNLNRKQENKNSFCTESFEKLDGRTLKECKSSNNKWMNEMIIEESKANAMNQKDKQSKRKSTVHVSQSQAKAWTWTWGWGVSNWHMQMQWVKDMERRTVSIQQGLDVSRFHWLQSYVWLTRV